MRNFFLPVIFLLLSLLTNGQSRVFKEVSEDVSSEMKLIMQNNNLVGYLVFTQLEKASADSFNYKISLMDENLNDIGVVNFREQKLNLDAVAFEQDVLCLAYLKSNIIGKEFNTKKEYADYDKKNFVYTQFISLDGRILKSNEESVELYKPINYDGLKKSKTKFVYQGGLKRGIQLKNVPGQGFIIGISDKHIQKLIAYNFKGDKIWNTAVATENYCSLLTTENNVFVLQAPGGSRGHFHLSNLNVSDGSENYEIILVDDKGNSLNVLSWDKNPVTGIPYISGSIINKNKSAIYTANDLARNPYIGVFAIDLSRAKSKDSVIKKFTYWDDGNQVAINSKGRLTDSKRYFFIKSSFKDYSNNTFFVATELSRKFNFASLILPAIGGIAMASDPNLVGDKTTLILSGVTAFAPLGIAIFGTRKWQSENSIIFKVNPKGLLTVDGLIPNEKKKAIRGSRSPTLLLNDRLIFPLDNPATKTNYVISMDKKNIVVFNANKKKTYRTIPIKSGELTTLVFPAKEGHIMILESNKKEKYTRLSIESLN